MKIIKNPIFLGISFLFLIWLFNILYYNQLLERFDKAMEEHIILLEIDSINKIKLDSLRKVYKELYLLEENTK